MKYLFLGHILGILLALGYYNFVSPFEDPDDVSLEPGTDPLPAKVDAGK